MASGFPVPLVIRNSGSAVRWMEVRDWLKREGNGGKKPVKQIVFEGEQFDVMCASPAGKDSWLLTELMRKVSVKLSAKILKE
jgi:hypothetical protein